jgi:2-keto-4-pentenoate hydratase/DNA-binding beta-propeller fold protein YncE
MSTISSTLTAGFLALGLTVLSQATEGPGILKKSFTANELYKPMGYLDSSKKGVRGHAAMQFFKGYLAVVEGRDSGLGDAAIAFFDISDPENPKRVSTHADQHTKVLFEGHNYGFIEKDGRDYVFLNAQTGIQIWDWTDIMKPTHVSSLKIPKLTKGAYANTAWWLAMQYPYIYVGGTNTGLHIVDASDLNSPKLKRSIPMSKLGGFKIGSLFTCGNLLVCNTFDAPGISVLDIGDPLNPKLQKTLKETFGYSSLFNGGYLYGIAEKPKVWDLHDPENMKLISSYTGEKLGSKGGYGVFQDGYLHQGASSGYAKIDMRDPKNPKLVKKLTMKIPHQDFDGANVIGNFVIMSCDHGTGSHIIAHQSEPDTLGPEVNFISPANGSQNNHRLSRIGLTFTDEVDHHNLDKIIIREVGGKTLQGHWSLHNAILNFTPTNALTAESTYEIILPAGSILDQVGNPLTKPFRSVFSTGKTLSEFKIAISRTKPTELGKATTFKVAEPAPNTTYSWDFGDGTPATAYSSNSSVSHTFKNLGHYQVLLHARQSGKKAAALQAQLIFNKPTSKLPSNSSTIALDHQRQRIWNVNPDNGSVTVLDATTMQKIKEIAVGPNPRTLSIASNIVAVAEEDQLYLIDADTLVLLHSIALGSSTHPYGVVLTQDAKIAYVSSEALGVIYEVDCVSAKIRRTIKPALKQGTTLRGLALNADQDTLYATRFISPDSNGVVYQIDLTTGKTSELKLAIDNTPDTEDSGRGLPNYLSQIVISPDGSQAWVPSKKDNIQRGLARDGKPLTFESTVRPIASKIALPSGTEVIAHRHDFNDKEMPIAAVYSPLGDMLFVAMQGSNSIEVLDAYEGTHITSILDVGSAPRGLALDPKTNTLFAHNFLDRSVAAFDVAGIINDGDGVANHQSTTKVVAEDKMNSFVLKGKKIFHHAANPQMSRDSYISCASCHQDGGQDGRVWDFTDRGEGLRNTTTLLGKAGEKHGPLHWSANFDEIHDFEHDIRGAFGGTGLTSSSDSPQQFFNKSHPLGFPKAGISKDLDALATYVRSLGKTPTSPHRTATGKLTEAALRGKKRFQQLNCASCHGGDEFTDSSSRYVHNVGTISKTSGKRLNAKLEGIDTPTLKGVWATAPYLHDGSAKTLREVLTTKNNKQLHGKTASLSDQQIDDLVSYLQQIDDTEPSAGTINTPESSTKIVDHNTMAKNIINAIKTKVPTAPISSLVSKAIPMDEAYKIQTIYDSYMKPTYGNTVGYKMAYASKASQEKWGIPAPVSGTFFKNQQVETGGSVKADTFLGFHIESEVAFILKKDIRKPIKKIDDLMPFIKSVHVGLDVPDLRFDKSKGKVQVADVIAMSCGTHTYVLGKGVPPKGLDYSKMQIALTRDGKEVYAGAASNVMGDPRESLRQLANRMIKAGTPLRKNQFVLTGSVAGAYFPKEKSGRPGKYIGTATGLPTVELNVK